MLFIGVLEFWSFKFYFVPFFSLSGLELCRDLLRKYRSLMDSEKGWLSATGAKVKTMLNRADLESVTVSWKRFF